MTDEQFVLISGLLIRIADALEQLAAGSAPREPGYVRPIGEYSTFDWSSIGASVVASDRDGPTHIEWGGYVWLRRSPTNKFNPAIWYSRPSGKDADGNTLYLRLISFKPLGDADPLPEKARAEAGQVKQPARSNGKGSAQQPVNPLADATAETDPLKPKLGNDYRTYYEKLAPAYGLDKLQAQDILATAHNDALAAYETITREFALKLHPEQSRRTD